MESYRERVFLAAVIAPNESLCQTNLKGFKVLPQTAVASWFEILLQDERVHGAGIKKKPENVSEKKQPHVMIYQMKRSKHSFTTCRTLYTSF